jgi:hypothetical protein
MRPVAVTIDTTTDAPARPAAAGQKPRSGLPFPKGEKRRSWWPFRRQEPDIALRLLAVHMDHATPRR